MPRRVHYAWVVLGALVVIMIAAGGLRSAFGVFIKPIEAELGWSRTALSIAAALSLLLYGALAPFAGRAADLWGARTVFTASLGLMALGASVLLGVETGTARWVGVAAAGGRLAWEGLK